MKRWTIILSLTALVQFLFYNCSDRLETPTIEKDSTIVYPSKSENGIDARITFCEKISKKTGRLINPGNVFSIKENEKVTAVINLTNRDYHRDKELMFHVDWLDSNNNSLFKKRIDLDRNDSAAVLTSTLGISPGKRQPGLYSFRVFLFRELIAEKKYVLIRPIIDSSAENVQDIIENLKAEITFCKGLSKATGAPIGAGNKFIIKNKTKVIGVINLENAEAVKRPIEFYAEWIDPENKSFFKKKILVLPGTKLFTSSVSTSPDKRKPGSYSLQIYLSGKLIAEKKFELLEDIRKKNTGGKKQEDKGFSAEITLCKKIDKETGEPIDVDSIFTIKANGKISALIRLDKKFSGSKDLMKFVIDWIGPNDSSFYRKKIELAPDDSSSAISSSISISSQKRLPGNYLVRVFLRKNLIAERKFLLKSENP